jgi:hypothetical protein
MPLDTVSNLIEEKVCSEKNVKETRVLVEMFQELMGIYPIGICINALTSVLIKCLFLMNEKDLNIFFADFDSQREFIYKTAKMNQEKFGSDFVKVRGD